MPERKLQSAAPIEAAAPRAVGVRNPSARICRRVAAMSAAAPQAEYPYLKFDGHMSPKGHTLVAEEVLAALGAADLVHTR